MADLEDTFTKTLQNHEQIITDRNKGRSTPDTASSSVTKRIDSIRLHLEKRFCVKQENVSTGCTILPNGNLLIANCYQKSVLMEYSEDCRYICDIPCSKEPFDLTIIDYDRIAITHGHGSSNNIEILNMNNKTIEKEVNLNSSCYGISYQDNKLVRDRIYFTAKHNQTVHCISMAGDEIWVRKEISLINPWDIVVDDYQNVFIVDSDSNSLIVIQHDRSSSRKLLSGRKGLIKPRSLHYNKDKKALLVCDNNGGALYNFM
ncbi:Hypothetical predicted protein [Mytilus galloprovincialis]|uniref:Uncharacterized protein n=1 Tax=Mytilus galloprovincialis TaxID=29158 RepID=A0A8B6CTK2_MYTGA|nr:Hypothetical predicted protein [Mytilus galloprovincialis]